MQKITTREPTLDMLEIAIISIKCALRDEFPEFNEFYAEKAWIKKLEANEAPAETEESNEDIAAIADAAAEELEKTLFQTEAETKEDSAE